MKVSRATASRDFALCRRIQIQFIRLFGRPFDRDSDTIEWSWDWSHYGFRAPESVEAGYRAPIGQFAFDTRDVVVEEEDYCGFDPSSWQSESDRSDETNSDWDYPLWKAYERRYDY